MGSKQYPRHSVGNIVKDTINQLRMKEQRKRYNAGETVKQQKISEKQQFALQYRGNISMEFVKNLSKVNPVQTIFTTRALKSCLPSLKSSVVSELYCNGCKSIYVGQTWRHITRVAELAKADTPMKINAIECNGEKTALQWKILEDCGKQSKLMILEAFYITTLKPRATNTEHENSH